MQKTIRAVALLTFINVALSGSIPSAKAQDPGTVQLFDTVAPAERALSGPGLGKAAGWKPIPEDQVGQELAGDLVMSNGKLALVCRQKGRAGELYAIQGEQWILRAELLGLGSGPAARTKGIKIVENSAGNALVEVSYATEAGDPFAIAWELKAGELFVQTQVRAEARGLRVLAPCRFAVLPDFFADDMVVDATSLAVAQTELPSEHFLLHMVGTGEAMVMAIWHPAQDDVVISLSGQDKARVIDFSEIHYAKGGKISVAVLSSPGIWHVRDIAAKDGNQVLHLNWKAPYPAHWRVDWQRDDKLTDSWEMLTQKPDGEYVKHGWYGQPESFGNVDWLKEGRQRWTTVLGMFLYPCWVNKEGEGYLQPLKKGVRFQGPALIYPINRLSETPLDAFTVVDVMRATLGVGPCEYILDVEGQKKAFQGRPTCASRTILDGIYGSKEQKAKRAQVEKTLDEVIAFVRHIRGRIEDYSTFSHEMVAYLEEQKSAQPALTQTLAEMQELTRRIDRFVAQRKERIRTPQYAAGLVDDFRTTLVDYEGPDALERCKKTTAALVDIGGNQDELVGECRMVVKALRQKAALAMASDPRLAPVANEVRRRTQQMLRNPTSYEAPRH